jgi:hypothetical protein
MGVKASKVANVLDHIFNHLGLLGWLCQIVWQPFRKKPKG